MTTLFDLSPDQLAAARAYVDYLAGMGIEATVDEAQLASNLDQWLPDAVTACSPARPSKALRRLLADKWLRQAVCLVLAKMTVRQHTCTYEGDVNLRAVDLLPDVLGVVTKVAKDGGAKPVGG